MEPNEKYQMAISDCKSAILNAVLPEFRTLISAVIDDMVGYANACGQRDGLQFALEQTANLEQKTQESVSKVLAEIDNLFLSDSFIKGK